MASSRKKNTSLVDQFCSVTGASKEVGKQLLEACNNNLELAVNMHMESHGAGAGAENDAVRAPIPQTEEVLVDEAPAYAAYNRRKRKTRSVFDGFRDFQEEATPARGRRKTRGQQEEAIMAGASGSRVSHKTRTLQDLFRPPVDLTYKGTFANARETGKSQGRWLMVNIQNVQEFACQALNRDVWSNSAVKALVKDSFIFWQVYHDSEEGQRYCQFYKVTEWPYVAVIDPTTGENLISWNNIEPLSFCDIIGEFLQRHPTMETLSPTQPAKRAKMETDTILDANEDDQLQAAIKASLTEVSKPSCTVTRPDSPSEVSDASDLETFTDSDSDVVSSPVKTRRRSNSSSPVPRSQTRKGSKSPNVRRSPRRNSDSDSNNESVDTCVQVKKLRNRSPLASYSSGINEESKRPQRKCSPKRNRNSSPVPETANSAVDTSRKRSPMRNARTNSASPQKVAQNSKSIHNDVHPAVIENIRRHSLSDADDVQNSSNLTDAASSESEVVESDKSADSLPVDTRDYKTYLGPESDEKVTLMLRFPDGQRDRLSIAYTSKLMAVVLYVGTKGFSNERFELIAQFPHRQLSQLDYDATLKDIGLHAQETIFIQARH